MAKLPDTLPDSILPDEREEWYRDLRTREKSGHRARLGIKVAEPEHALVSNSALNDGNEDVLHQKIKEQPDLSSRQYYDGSANARPALSSTALKEYENAKREQELDYKLRNGLVNSPKFNPKPGVS